MIKIALAEDNTFLAASLLEKLGLFDEFQVRFHALNGKNLLEKLETDNNIDLILMDIQMPEMDGIEATRQVVARYPQIKIVMLTIVDTEQSVYEAIRAGASGYLVKESSPVDIQSGIHQALSGGAALSPNIALKAMSIIRDPEVVDRKTVDPGLSERELDVLRQMSKGLGYRQIATNLFISPNTVRRHQSNIYEKLEVTNKVEALAKAHEYKLL